VDTTRFNIFKAKTSLVDQYSAFKVFPDLNLNGEFTLAKHWNLGGLKCTIKAYKLSLNGKSTSNGWLHWNPESVFRLGTSMARQAVKKTIRQIASDPHIAKFKN
jgi:putative endopeptidase